MADQHIGYPGSVSSAQLATWLPNAASAQYSVEGLEDGRVVANAIGDRGVTVKPGVIIGDGIYDFIETDRLLNFAAVPTGSPDRWDMVVLRRTWNATPGASTSVYTIIQGGATRSLPARLTNRGVQADQPMALVRLRAGMSAVQEIVDLRCWAHNGGVQAIDELVMSYLDNYATEVNIGGAIWTYRVSLVGSNYVGAWEKSTTLGRIPLFNRGGVPTGNATPPAGTQYLFQAGSTVLTTDANAFGKLIWPTPFPNGVLTVQLMNGDDSNFNDMGLGVAGSGWGTSPLNKTYCAFRIWGATSGVRSRNWPNRTVRIEWLAIGW